jgi:hypothetical protein
MAALPGPPHTKNIIHCPRRGKIAVEFISMTQPFAAVMAVVRQSYGEPVCHSHDSCKRCGTARRHIVCHWISFSSCCWSRCCVSMGTPLCWGQLKLTSTVSYEGGDAL